MSIAQLIEVNFNIVEFWSDGLIRIHIITRIALISIYIDYILPRVYNHFITSTLCQQLASADLSLRAQTLHFVSEAIKYGATHLSFSLVFLISNLIYR